MMTSSPGKPTFDPIAAEFLPTEIRKYGKYFLIRKLAEGGMAEIFLAKQVGAEGFERNVVIKRMLPHLSAVQDFVGMFLDEAKLAARLAHPNIVQINDLGLAEGCYYICLEYLAGEDFSSLVRTASKRRQYLPIPIVAKVIAEAARGLHYAHEFSDEMGRPMNIVHRDVSPSNIYVTYEGQVKVLDFGIAKAESRVTNTTAGIVKGKYMYMSPEQAGGDTVDRRADVFALGVSLYEALTHVRPFGKENDLAILNSVLKNEFRKPTMERPDLPHPLEAIILKAMAGDRELRYSSALALAQDLEKFIVTLPDASVVTQLPGLMRGLFGDDWIARKTRVPTLQSFINSGVFVPGITEEKGSTGAETKVTRPPDTVSAPVPVALEPKAEPVESPSRRAGAWKAVAAALLLLVGLGGYAWLRPRLAGGPSLQPPGAYVGPGLSPPPQDPPVAAPDPLPMPPPPLPKPPDVIPPPDGPVASPPRRTRSTAQPRIHLEAGDIERVVARKRDVLMQCFEQHKEDLTKDEGVTDMRFTIVSSGSVTGPKVTGDLANTAVAGCLERRIAQFKFPAHKDKELTLQLPFKYRVSR